MVELGFCAGAAAVWIRMLCLTLNLDVEHEPRCAGSFDVLTSIFITFLLKLKNPNRKTLRINPKPYTLYPKPEILF